ncbi:MAG: chromosome condensation regulator [Candidatus Saccharibacteria bacterium]|nr:chromosome condensation regulator [Candidatus Saccharibacteria bacterium]
MGRMQRLADQKTSYSRAFALPTILIASTVMLIVLLAAVQATVSTNNAINNQYIDKIGKEAAESGITMAEECLTLNGSITWSSATPLKPNTDCNGADLVTCTDTSTAAACYVLASTNYRSSFTVGVILSGTTPTDFDAKGIVSTVRTSSLGVASQSNYSIKSNFTQGLLESVGVLPQSIAFDTYPASNGTVATPSLCGVTDAGAVWCSGYANPGSNGLDAKFGNIAFKGAGTLTCYTTSPVNAGSCTSTSGTMYLANLSDATNGIFRGKVMNNATPTTTTYDLTQSLSY